MTEKREREAMKESNTIGCFLRPIKAGFGVTEGNERAEGAQLRNQALHSLVAQTRAGRVPVGGHTNRAHEMVTCVLAPALPESRGSKPSPWNMCAAEGSNIVVARCCCAPRHCKSCHGAQRVSPTQLSSGEMGPEKPRTRKGKRGLAHRKTTHPSAHSVPRPPRAFFLFGFCWFLTCFSLFLVF